MVEGIEFRSMTVTAWKGKQGPCFERKQAVVYKGPWKQVVDDDGHTLLRGQRMAVCDKTFHIYMSPPYKDQMIPVLPHELPPLEGAPDFDCSRDGLRHPKETKGEDYAVTDLVGGEACEPGSCC